jgi:hypothetical protein
VPYLDAPAGLPSNVDSLDVWPLLSGEVSVSPRTEVPIAIEGTVPSGTKIPTNVSALIVGDYKLIVGGLVPQNFWQGPSFPNASYTAWMKSLGANWWHATSSSCGSIDGDGGCLFDIAKDPHETVDISHSMPAKVLELKARMRELRRTLFNPDRCAPFKPPLCGEPEFLAAVLEYGGYLGPYLKESTTGVN